MTQNMTDKTYREQAEALTRDILDFAQCCSQATTLHILKYGPPFTEKRREEILEGANLRLVDTLSRLIKHFDLHLKDAVKEHLEHLQQQKVTPRRHKKAGTPLYKILDSIAKM